MLPKSYGITQGWPLAPGQVPGFVPPVGDANRFMFWASRMRVASGTSGAVTAASGTNFMMTRIVVGSPPYAVRNPRFHFSGFASTEDGTAPIESIVAGNAMTINGVWVSVAGADPVRLRIGGQQTATIASGATGLWTDEAELAIPANAEVAIYTSYSVAAGEKAIPVYRVQDHRGERIWGASDAASLVPMLTGALQPSTPSLMTGFGQAQVQYFGPDMSVARGWDGRAVALVASDSIGESRQEFALEADARGNLGWLRRWLDDASVSRIPHFMMGMPGAGSVRELNTNATKRWDVLDQAAAFNAGGALPFTMLLTQLGQNDLNTTYSTMQANYTGFLDRFIARYPTITTRLATGVLPRTTSTDTYTSRINQTPSTGNEWANGATPWGAGNKWTLEAYKQGGAGGRLTGYIDTRPYFLDPAPASGKSPATWPAPTYSTTLAAQAGTDGTTPYNSIQVVGQILPGEVISYGTGGMVAYRVEGTGPYTVYDDGTARTIVAAAGSPVLVRTTPDGVHPYRRTVQQIAAAIPQSGKALFK